MPQQYCGNKNAQFNPRVDHLLNFFLSGKEMLIGKENPP